MMAAVENPLSVLLAWVGIALLAPWVLFVLAHLVGPGSSVVPDIPPVGMWMSAAGSAGLSAAVVMHDGG